MGNKEVVPVTGNRMIQAVTRSSTGGRNEHVTSVLVRVRFIQQPIGPWQPIIYNALSGITYKFKSADIPHRTTLVFLSFNQ